MQLRCNLTLKRGPLWWSKNKRVQSLALSVACVILAGIAQAANAHDSESQYMDEPYGPGGSPRESTPDGATLSPPQAGPGRGFRRRQFAGDEPGLPSASPGKQGQFPPGARFGGDRPRRGAQGGQGMGGRQFFGGPLDLTPLGLSESQKEKVRQLRLQSSAKARELKKTLQAKRSEMRNLMFNPQAADLQIRSQRKELRKMQDQLEDIILDDFLAVRRVLTPEQLKHLPEVKPTGLRGSSERGAFPEGFGSGHHNRGKYKGQPYLGPRGGSHGQPGEDMVPEGPLENLPEPPAG